MEIVVQIDSREKTHAIENITKYFDEKGIKYYTNKLLVGDYQNLHNPRVIVDRKQSLVELQSNITQQHERFRNELIKAQENGIKLFVLIQEEKVSCLEDIALNKYFNPRVRAYNLEKKKAEKLGKVFNKKPPLSNSQFYKILYTLKEKYGVIFCFANKKNIPAVIERILKYEVI